MRVYKHALSNRVFFFSGITLKEHPFERIHFGQGFVFWFDFLPSLFWTLLITYAKSEIHGPWYKHFVMRLTQVFYNCRYIYLILSQIILEKSCLVVHPASTFQQEFSYPQLQHMRRVWIIRDWWYWKRGFFSFANTVNFPLDVKWSRKY